MPALKNLRHERFCLEYIKDGNGKAAYCRAGYAPNTAEQAASRLLRNVKVQNRIAELRQDLRKIHLAEVSDVIRHLSDLICADPSELTALHLAPCRYCYGTDHAYQWRTMREFDEAIYSYNGQSAAKRKLARGPSKAGGFGYSRRQSPNPECPECNGFGEAYINHADTRFLSPGAKLLFAGIKQTAQGYEVKLHNKLVALSLLLKHFDTLEKKPAQPDDDSLMQLINDINAKGSKARLVP